MSAFDRAVDWTLDRWWMAIVIPCVVVGLVVLVIGRTIGFDEPERKARVEAIHNPDGSTCYVTHSNGFGNKYAISCLFPPTSSTTP